MVHTRLLLGGWSSNCSEVLASEKVQATTQPYWSKSGYPLLAPKAATLTLVVTVISPLQQSRLEIWHHRVLGRIQFNRRVCLL